MLKIEISEKEIQNAIKKLRFYQSEKKNQIKKQILLSSFAVQKKAKELAPVRDGILKNSIFIDVGLTGLDASVGTNVKYAPFQEFGTRYQKGKAFLYPAWEAERNKFYAKAAEILKLR